MKRLLGALAALLLASPAWGEIVYVPEDPPGIDPSGYTVGADTVILGSNSYSAILTPATAGTEERPKVWIGQGAGVVFAGVVPKSHNRFYNITFLGSVTFPANGKHIMFDGCTLGGLNMMDADSSSVRNCTVRGTQFRIAVQVTGGSNADADTLDGCTFTSLSASGGEPAMFMGYNADGAGDSNTDSCRYFVQRFNTFNVSQSGGSGSTFSKHFQCPNFTSYHNTYNLTSTATGLGDEAAYGVLFRDNCYNGLMRGDRIFVNNEGASISHYALMWPGGMAPNNASNHHFTVDSCYVRVFRGNGIYLKTRMPSLKIVNCVVRSRLGTALDVTSGYEGTADEPYLHHNTFMGDVAAHLGEFQRTTGGFSNNILWGTSTATCGQYAGAVVNQGGGLTSFSDSNLVYSTTGITTKAFYQGGACMAVNSGAWAALGNDTHSAWVKPQFGDTAWATLDARPLLDFSLAYQDIASGFTLGYAGAHSDGYYDYRNQAIMQNPTLYYRPWSYPAGTDQ